MSAGISFLIQEAFVCAVGKTAAHSNYKSVCEDLEKKVCLALNTKVLPPRFVNGQESLPYCESKVSTTRSENGQEPLLYPDSRLSTTREEPLHYPELKVSTRPLTGQELYPESKVSTARSINRQEPLLDLESKNPPPRFLDGPEPLLYPESKVSTARSINGQEPLLYPEPKVSITKSVIGQQPLRYSESKFPAPKPSCPEPLDIFVIGPSLCGKRVLIECVAKQSLGIPTEKNIYFAYNISGFLLQGVEVGINLWHVGNIHRSLNILKDFYKKSKTCFMLVYDVNDSTTFEDVHQWIPSLRRVLDDHVSIVLVGYEDSRETLTPNLVPVPYSDAMNTKTVYDLKTFYEFSDLTGAAVSDLIFEAAHIALESKRTASDSESDENSTLFVNCGPVPGLNEIDY